MKKFIVTTTIYKPSKAIKLFDKIKDWTLIVVGDKKTPTNFKLNNGIYLKPSDQVKLDRKLSNLIGWNCIQRRNFGFILAKKLGADIVATVDDDNIPYKNWGMSVNIDNKIKVNDYRVKDPVFDSLSVTNYPKLWHRGFPIQLLATRKILSKKTTLRKFDIQANFWNGDPDIDAICRMEHKPVCKFNKNYFPFSSNKITPFNSQNTILSIEAVSKYMMFPHVGRMDDIYASYYLQALGFKVFFDQPTVYQKRNNHNLTKDFNGEIIGYQNNLLLIKEIMKNPENIKKFIPKISYEALKQYKKNF